MAESTPKSKGPAHLVDDGTLKRCSVCQYPFLPDAQPNINEAFAKHLRIAHKPVQTREDANSLRHATSKNSDL
jgi:hypothetical protein